MHFALLHSAHIAAFDNTSCDALNGAAATEPERLLTTPIDHDVDTTGCTNVSTVGEAAAVLA
jgi:hypothetical protein